MFRTYKIILREYACTLLKSLNYLKDDSPTHGTTRVTTHTCYMYCCHNTGFNYRDFKFSFL